MPDRPGPAARPLSRADSQYRDSRSARPWYTRGVVAVVRRSVVVVRRRVVAVPLRLFVVVVRRRVVAVPLRLFVVVVRRRVVAVPLRLFVVVVRPASSCGHSSNGRCCRALATSRVRRRLQACSPPDPGQARLVPGLYPATSRVRLRPVRLDRRRRPLSPAAGGVLSSRGVLSCCHPAATRLPRRGRGGCTRWLVVQPG
jgi:hypothetical protein